MIAFTGNRPAIQVGRHQVHDYDTEWLASALERAACAADRHDFPFLDEILRGVEEYLEQRCSLSLLPLAKLFERMRRMLETIGCDTIAAKLEPVGPPVTLCLAELAEQAGNGFELAFFERLRHELRELRQAGVEEVRFRGLREGVQVLAGGGPWCRRCDELEAEVEAFLGRHDRHGDRAISPRLSLRVPDKLAN